MPTWLSDGIAWVGFVDWNVRDFHSYDTYRGTTYNAYLILDERPTLIDAVKQPYSPTLLAEVAKLCPLDQLAYVVCNHAEPDHAGVLPQVMAAAPQAQLLCNAKCLDALKRFFDTSAWNVRLVSSGEELSIGRRSLRFIDTPMVHWPESMFTYIPQEQLLFSMDAFGQHYATSARFDDEHDLAQVLTEAKAYYANIVMPYGKAVSNALDAAQQLSLRMVAPSHGVIWRSHLPTIFNAYLGWSRHRAVSKIVILFDSMWDSTAAMAEAVYTGAAQSGIEVQILHVRRTSLTRIATEVLDAAGLAIGSATLNRDMMPAMAAALSYLKGLRPQNKAAFAFGSYGWGKGAAEAIGQWIDQMCWETVSQPIRCQYRPDQQVLDQCVAAGRALADRVRTACSETPIVG